MNIIDLKEGTTAHIMKKPKNPVDLVLQYLDDIVQVHGSIPRVADLLGVSRQTVYNWISRKSDPHGDNLNAIVRLYTESLPGLASKEDAIMAIREVAETYAMDFEFNHALATQGQIYLRKVAGGRTAVCRARDPHYPMPEDAMVVYGEYVCSWSVAQNNEKYVLTNVDGSEVYILDELPTDIVIGEMISGFRPKPV